MICALLSLFCYKIRPKSIEKIKPNENTVIPITNKSQEFLLSTKNSQTVASTLNNLRDLETNTFTFTNNTDTDNFSTQSVTFSTQSVKSNRNSEQNKFNEYNSDECSTLEYINPMNLVDNDLTINPHIYI
jgi:hypothetical protein